MVVFPEGARTFSGHMREFKKGAFQMADQLQLPVVPMTIDGSFDVLPRTSKLLHWHRMKLTIHQPIYPIGKGPENQKMLLEESYKAIESGLPENTRDRCPSNKRASPKRNVRFEQWNLLETDVLLCYVLLTDDDSSSPYYSGPPPRIP